MVSFNNLSLPFFLDNPEMIYLLPILLLLLLIILIKSFVKFDPSELNKKKAYRFWMIISRTLIMFLLVVALMNPYINKREVDEGQPTVTILYDNSSSMEILDFEIKKFAEDIEKEVATSVVYIASGEESNLGEEIFRNLDQQNLMLVSDGNNHGTLDFRDVIAFANNKNITINVLNLGEKYRDASIVLKGAGTSIVDTDYTITLELNNLKGPVPVVVNVDDMPIFSQEINEKKTLIKHKFTTKGHHKIKAEIKTADHFPQNNAYYKVVEIVEKPKVYYMSSRKSAIDMILGAKYEFYNSDIFPTDLEQYYLIAINNKMQDITVEQAKQLESFVDNGNGLVVIGGENSFVGASTIDLLLPVKSGQTEEKGSGFNFLFLFDMSGLIDNPIMPTELAALNTMIQLTMRNEIINIAAAEFSYNYDLYHEFAHISNYDEFREALKAHKDQTHIYGAVWLRPANLAAGLRGALKEFEGRAGNNNIVIVTDGNIREEVLQKSVEIIKQIRDTGTRVHVIHMSNPDLDSNILRQVNEQISSAGRGMFMTQEKDVNSLFEKGLIIANKNHWVTEGLSLAAYVTEHNDVIAIPSADVLVSTGTGVPIITTSSFNRVAVISTDDGTYWSTTMYEPRNIGLISRLMDWSIGDPNRKKAEYTKITSSEVDDYITVEYKGNNPPLGCEFYKVVEFYECKFTNTNQGFSIFNGIPYAVNYDEEYLDIGFNEKQLALLAKETGGTQNSQGQIDFIVKNAEEKSRIERVVKNYIDWWFVIAALIIFLIELTIRRLTERFKNT